MKDRLLTLTTLVPILLIGLVVEIMLRQNKMNRSFIRKQYVETYVEFDDTRKVKWDNEFNITVKVEP